MDTELKREFESLGRAVKAGFDGVDRRFDGLEGEMDDLKGMKGTLQRALAVAVDTNERVKEVEGKVRVHDEKFDTLLTNQDWMIGVLTRLDQERIMSVRVTDDMRKDLHDLKQRVARLETAAA